MKTTESLRVSREFEFLPGSFGEAGVELLAPIITHQREEKETKKKKGGEQERGGVRKKGNEDPRGVMEQRPLVGEQEEGGGGDVLH